jgi:hypothetical protein
MLRSPRTCSRRLNIDPQLEAKRRTSMTMQDWEVRLGGFLKLWDREVLQGAGKVTADIAKAHAAFFSASVHLCFLSASSLLRSTLSASKTLIASADTTAAKFGSPAKTHVTTERLITVGLPGASHSCMATNQHASLRLPKSVEYDHARDLTREDAPIPRRCSLKFGSFRRLFLLKSLKH